MPKDADAAESLCSGRKPQFQLIRAHGAPGFDPVPAQFRGEGPGGTVHGEDALRTHSTHTLPQTGVVGVIRPRDYLIDAIPVVPAGFQPPAGQHGHAFVGE